MIRYCLVYLLLAGVAWVPQARSQSAAHNQKPAVSAATAVASPAPNNRQNQEAEASNLPPDAPVITIKSQCGDPANSTKDSKCKTIVVTRAEFERLAEAIQPAMQAPSRRQFANRYAVALVLAQKAEEMGLDKKTDFEEHMRLARLQIMGQTLNRALLEKSSVIPDADIENYYQKNLPAFEQAVLLRVYIPRIQQLPTPEKALTEVEAANRKQASEKIMQAKATELQARAMAGEDFNKLQEDAYQAAGINSKALNTRMDAVRRSTLPTSQASALDLKVGEVSGVLSDQSGYFICKISSKEVLPLDRVREEIHEILRTQRMREEMLVIESSATSTFNDKYFGAADSQ